MTGSRILLNDKTLEVHWDGHASVRTVDEGFTVAVDPFSRVSPDFTADIILITKSSEGHFDPDFLEKVSGPRTVLVLPELMKDSEVPCDDVEYLGENERIDIYNVEIEAVPVYDEDGESGEGLGYRFVMGSTSVYVAGETDFYDDLIDLEGRVDYAFLPVEGECAMGVDEAARTAVKIKPRVTVPYNYGGPFFDEEVDLQGLMVELERRNLKCEILDSGFTESS